MKPHASPFARYSLAIYALLVVYGSLYPFAGWRDRGVPPFEFLTARLPHWYTSFDVAANVAGYFPLGFLALIALAPPLRRGVAYVAVLLGAALASVGVEALQNYLPGRFPSNLDVAANVAGALLGAFAGQLAARQLVERRALFALRDHWFLPGARVDAGLVLVALWLFTQLNPATLLFGNGDLRAHIETASVALHPAQTFVRIEAAVAAANIVALAALLGLLAARALPLRVLVVAVIAGALATRAGAYAVLFHPYEAFAWLTPGALAGLAVGTVLAMLVVLLPRRWVGVICGMALMAATVLVNLAPGNPYHAHAFAVWPQGHFLNFNGLTRLVSLLWPFAALAFLLAAGARPRAGAESNDGAR
jgi:VanZ family protein